MQLVSFLFFPNEFRIQCKYISVLSSHSLSSFHQCINYSSVLFSFSFFDNPLIAYSLTYTRILGLSIIASVHWISAYEQILKLSFPIFVYDQLFLYKIDNEWCQFLF